MKEFSEKGKEIYSGLANRPINTVQDLANALKRGEIKPSQIPVDYVDMDGTRLMLNTRTTTALEEAGVPRNTWFGRDRTGVTAYDNITFDDLARRQLKNNRYGPEGRR